MFIDLIFRKITICLNCYWCLCMWLLQIFTWFIIPKIVLLVYDFALLEFDLILLDDNTRRSVLIHYLDDFIKESR